MNVNLILERNCESSNINAQHYYNKGQNVNSVNLQTGDRVIVKQDKINKLTPLFDLDQINQNSRFND